MHQKLELTNNITIDFLIPVAEKGGVENCVNMISRFLADKGVNIRVIQIVYEGAEWLDESIAFFPLMDNSKSHSVQEYIDGYKAFLKDNGTPTMIIAITWPLAIYVAKAALSAISSDCMVFSYLHAPFERYEKANVGSIEDLSYADAHLAISNEIADFIKANVDSPIIYRVNNPLNQENIHPVSDLKKGTLLFVGRLEKEKNISFILDTISKTRASWHLKIIGDGSLMEPLKKQASELDIFERTEFIGWSEDPWKYAEGSCALILSSIFEGSPLVALESLACGLPVIGNISSRVSEVVSPGMTGYIYKDNDEYELVQLLDELYECDDFPFSPEQCRLSVRSHMPATALFDFYAKIYASSNHRLIQNSLYRKGEDIINEKISIIIPCYNAENYIQRCLNSIIEQSLGIQHLELIIINDCSTDNSLQIMKGYEKSYPDIICIIDLDENSGQSVARNIGLSYASGNYILYVDADDCLTKDAILKMYLTMLCYPVDVVSCEYRSFDNAIPVSEDTKTVPLTLTITETDYDKRSLFMNQAFTTAPWGKLIRRSLLESHKAIYFPEGAHMEDIYFTYMLIGSATSWCHINLPLYNYYINPKGIMKSDKIKDYYMDVHNMFALAMEQFTKTGFYEACVQELAFMYYKKAFLDLTRFMMKSFYEFPSENFIIIREYMLKYFPNISKNTYLSTEDKKSILEYLKLEY